MKQAEEQIERFRRGEKFEGSTEAFIVGGKPDEKAIETFAKALRGVESQPVREQAARALVAIAQKTDPLYRAGGRLVRDRRILAILTQDGIEKPGTVRDYCLESLQSFVPPELLNYYGRTLTENLERWPDSTAFLVIAKANPPHALPVVEKLMRSPEWSHETSALIAKAALGDTAAESQLVEPFLTTKDAKEKARLAKLVGFIGTRSALTALASQMRTDLIFVLVGSYRRSVRLDIMAGLSYNFPDKLFLYDNAVQDDSGYDLVEKFCEQTFGVHWDRPRPPFLTIEGFPIPLTR